MKQDIEWTDSLSLGVKSIDDQHKELIRLVNLLFYVIEHDRSEDAIVEMLTRLREYSVFHFNAEEAFMEEIGYPKRGEHEQQHVELAQKVKGMQYARFRQEEVTLEEIKELLTRWLLEHILDSDLQIAQYLKEKNKE